MRNQRTYFLILAIALVAILSNLLSVSASRKGFSESYPALVCPNNPAGLNSFASLASVNTPVRFTGNNSTQSKKIGTRRPAITNQALIVESEQMTPVIWQSRSGVWAGSVICRSPQSSQWFIGASADITSKGVLTIVNSGLGKALAEVEVFTENGAQVKESVQIKPNSFSAIALPTLAPGARAISIHVLTRTGRLNSFVTDERGKGLRSLGGDLVNSTDSPQKVIYIPAIPQQTGKKSSLPHTLRILVPGDIDARIDAEIISQDGTFAPIGINGQIIASKKVVEYPLAAIMKSGLFALRITSDQPLLASVLSKTLSQGKSDFIWSTPAPQLSQISLAVTGLSPTLVFTGRSIKVELEITKSNGKKYPVVVQGADIASYQIGALVRSISITATRPGIYAGALITSKSGYGYIPLESGSQLTRTFVPSSNIGVLNP